MFFYLKIQKAPKNKIKAEDWLWEPFSEGLIIKIMLTKEKNDDHPYNITDAINCQSYDVL
jgi:hypothetical protein